MAQSTAHRRLLQEYRALTNNPPEGITAGPVSEDDLLHWEALIQGPEGTPFEGGVFPAELRFPKDYPLAPPTMKFLGEVFHPNGTAFSPIVHVLHKRMVSNKLNSLPQRPGVHLDSAPSR
jgi:ubiquitin-protein ligase